MSRHVVESLIVASVLVIVANVAIPVLAYVGLRARAVGIVDDARSIREAARDFHDDTGRWPPEASPGRSPADLRDRLDGSVVFERGDVAYDRENWIRDDGTSRYPRRGVRVGLSLRTRDEALIRMVERVWGSALPRRAGGVTFPIE